MTKTNHSRVLFIDDESAVRAAFARFMRSRGIDVDTVGTHQEAVELAETEPYGVVLSDLRMPDGDGVTLIEEIRRLNPDATYFLVTGSDLSGTVVPPASISRVVTKPWNPHELTQLVQEALDCGTSGKTEPVLRGLLVSSTPRKAIELEKMLARCHADPSEIIQVDSADRCSSELEARFHAAFVDLCSLRQGGLTAIRQLQSRAPNLPIIVFAERQDDPLVLAALDAGAHEYCAHPCDAPALERIIQHAIERQRTEARLAYLAERDELTGLLKRVPFRSRLAARLAWLQARAGSLALLRVDIKNLEAVNSTLGHTLGDKVLVQLASRLRALSVPTVARGRVSGHGLAIAVETTQGPEALDQLCGQIVRELSQALWVDAQSVQPEVAVGAAFARPEVDDVMEQLFHDADAAAHIAGKSSINGWHIYHTDGNSNHAEQRRFLDDLSKALARGELYLVYQPKVCLQTGVVGGAEALLRWHHPERGIVSPGLFIPALEASGQIVAVGEWVIHEVCRQLKAWQRAGLPLVPVAFNVSARQLEAGHFVEAVAGALHTHGVPASLLEIEITETLLMQDTQTNLALLGQLRELGIRLAVDDFGTGYSSRRYLTRFPIDVLKIDRAFVRDLSVIPKSADIVRAIVGLGQAIDLTVVAEGVETDAERDFLERTGCDVFQGFLYAPPLSPDAFIETLAPPAQRRSA